MNWRTEFRSKKASGNCGTVSFRTVPPSRVNFHHPRSPGLEKNVRSDSNQSRKCRRVPVALCEPPSYISDICLFDISTILWRSRDRQWARLSKASKRRVYAADLNYSGWQFRVHQGIWSNGAGPARDFSVDIDPKKALKALNAIMTACFDVDVGATSTGTANMGDVRLGCGHLPNEGAEITNLVGLREMKVWPSHCSTAIIVDSRVAEYNSR